jgi:hypothetical protein
MSNKEVIAKLRADADALEAADKAFSELSEEQRLAITLHSMLCHHNHIDGCGWEYEYLQRPAGWVGQAPADWAGHAHSRYLTKARNVIDYCNRHKVTTDAAIEIMKIAKDSR